MENTKYGRRRQGQWTPIRAKAQDTRANPNSWETHLVRKRWDIGLLRALSPRILMMMMMNSTSSIWKEILQKGCTVGWVTAVQSHPIIAIPPLLYFGSPSPKALDNI